jgi:acyl-CoA dehydrogenase
MSIYENEHLIFKKSIRKFCEKEILPFVDEWEDVGFFPSELFVKLAREGFLGILLDEKWGGVDKDLSYAAAWCEEIGRVPANGLAIAINMHSLVISPALQRFGSNEAKEKWLSAAAEGKAIGAYAFTEPGAGSDLSNIQTKAVKDGDYYIINGSKTFITNGARADFVLALTKTDNTAGYNGFTTFVLDTSAPGFTVTKTLSKLGWRCSDTAEMVFEDLKVHKSMILGELGQGWNQAMRSLEWERLMLTLTAIAGANSCIEDTITYTKQRKVFGKYVSSLAHTQEVLARLTSRLEAGRALCHRSLGELLKGKDVRVLVSLAKLSICEFAIYAADRCLQLHGGYGYTTEFRPERWLRDLRLNTIGGGTSEIMAKVAIKELSQLKTLP